MFHSAKACTDVRDKLYSLLGLSLIRDHFSIDYDDSCLALLGRYVDICIERPMEAFDCARDVHSSILDTSGTLEH